MRVDVGLLLWGVGDVGVGEDGGRGMSFNSSLSLCHHKGQRFDICCSLWISPFIKGSREEERTLGNWCTCTYTHTHAQINCYVYVVGSFFSTHTHIHLIRSTQPQSSNHTLTLINTTTQVCVSKKGPVVSLHQHRDAWLLAWKTPSSFFFFFGRGTEGGELNGIPSPRGTAKAEQCWNKWFMLLSSQVNSAALSAITISFSSKG